MLLRFFRLLCIFAANELWFFRNIPRNFEKPLVFIPKAVIL